MNKFKWQLLTTSNLLRDGNDPAKPAGGGDKPWIEGVTDAETVGYFKNRGLDGKPVIEALLATAQAHREAEKHLGAPAAEMVRIPKPEAAPEVKKAFYERLGRPAKDEDYDMSAVKDEGLAAALRKTVAEANLSKDAATLVAKGVLTHLDAQKAETDARKAETLTVERAALLKEWGEKNFPANKLLAQDGARRLGIDAALVETLEGAVGYAKIMEMFRKVGASTGEDTFVKTPSNTGVMTREEAMDRKKSLMADDAWVKSFLSGDSAKVRELGNLDKIIVGAV